VSKFKKINTELCASNQDFRAFRSHVTPLREKQFRDEALLGKLIETAHTPSDFHKHDENHKNKKINDLLLSMQPMN